MKLKLMTQFCTLNYKYYFLFDKLFFRKSSKKNNSILKYLSKYNFATKNELVLKNTEVPNNPIWQLWLQGRDNMPKIVDFCTNSILEQNPDREVILLTEENLGKYVEFPDYIQEKYKRGQISKIHYSDLIRLYLLCNYGGTWIDSTVYMTDKMPKYIVESDFFVFKDLTSSLITKNMTLEQFILLNNKLNFGAFTNSISFIHSKKNNPILMDTLKIMFEYWKHETSAIHYLFFSYILIMVIFNNQNYKEMFLNMPYKLTTVEYGCLQQCLFEHFNEEMFENIKKLTPIHKLVYKNRNRNIYKDSFLNYFESQIEKNKGGSHE